MINTLKKSVVYAGDYKYYPNEWLDLYDEKIYQERVEDVFESASKVEDPKRPQKKYITGSKFSSFIDNCEFVIRCSQLRSMEPYGSYGSRINAVVSNHFSFRTDKVVGDKEDLLRQNNIVQFRDHYDKYKISTFRPKKYEEMWVSLASAYDSIVRNKRKDFTSQSDALHENLKRIECWLSTNTKILSLDSYLSLRNEIISHALDFDGVIDLLGKHKWCEDILERYNRKLKKEPNYNPELRFSSQKNTLKITRGTQAIYMMINDKRFKDYDKYIIGHYMIINTFSHGDNDVNLLAEYLTVTNWIKEGKVKYLPEYIEKLNVDLEESNLLSCGNSKYL